MIFGNLAAEYNSFGAQQSPCATCYLSYDHLGSVRMVTVNSLNGNADIVARHERFRRIQPEDEASGVPSATRWIRSLPVRNGMMRQVSTSSANVTMVDHLAGLQLLIQSGHPLHFSGRRAGIVIRMFGIVRWRERTQTEEIRCWPRPLLGRVRSTGSRWVRTREPTSPEWRLARH
jgi:hypothetical protein